LWIMELAKIGLKHTNKMDCELRLDRVVNK
jgi:hypothetical protein